MTSQPTSAPIYRPPEASLRSFAEVWNDAHAYGSFGELELCFFVANALVLGGAIFSAWLLFPVVYGGGAAWSAYSRSFKAVGSGFGFLWSLTLAMGGLLVLMKNADEAGERFSWTLFDTAFPVILLFASAGLLVAWLSAAARGVASTHVEHEHPPRCEGCGYDLTELAMDARCPECGLGVAKSLVDSPRLGCAWQRRCEPGTWLQSACSVIMRPSAFFSHLKVRDHADISRRFARMNFPLIGVGAAAWFFLMIASFDSHPGDDLLIFPMVTLVLCPLLAWIVHRFIGAMSVAWWIFHAALPDGRWAETVIRYESAFLWVFCVANGCLLTTYIAWGEWISDLQRKHGITWILGLPPEVLAVLLLNLALCCLWLYRYHVAAKAVRWSNF